MPLLPNLASLLHQDDFGGGSLGIQPKLQPSFSLLHVGYGLMLGLGTDQVNDPIHQLP